MLCVVSWVSWGLRSSQARQVRAHTSQSLGVLGGAVAWEPWYAPAWYLLAPWLLSALGQDDHGLPGLSLTNPKQCRTPAPVLCALLGIHPLLGKKDHLDIHPQPLKLPCRATALCDMPHRGDSSSVAFAAALQAVFSH